MISAFLQDSLNLLESYCLILCHSGIVKCSRLGLLCNTFLSFSPSDNQIIIFKSIVCLLLIVAIILLILFLRSQNKLIAFQACQLRLFSESSKFGIAILDLKTSLCKADVRFREAYHVSTSDEKFSFQFILNFLQVGTRHQFESLIDEVKKGERENFTFEHRGKKRMTQFVIHCSLLKDPAFRGKQLLSFVIHNISEIVEKESLIQNSQSTLEVILDKNRIGILDLCLDTKLSTFSSTLNKMMGLEDANNYYSQSDLKQFIHPEDWDTLMMHLKIEFFQTIPSSEFCIRVIRSDSSIFWIRVYATSIKFGHQRFSRHIIFTVQDFDREVQVREELIDAKKSAEESDLVKTKFLENINHEIKTPLNAIVGFSDLIADTNMSVNEQHWAKMIKQNSLQLSNIIDDILVLSKIETINSTFRQSTFSVLEICNHVVESIRLNCTKDLNITANVENDGLMIHSDWSRLLQVLTNLMNNAVKFTDHGSVTLTARICEKSSEIEFLVQDSGIGISDEDQKRIFNRFVKLDPFAQGTGLGLAISHSIITSLQGSIRVKSRLGFGSTFLVSLPMDTSCSFNQTLDDGIVKESRKRLSTRRKLVLIAEDDDSNYFLLNTMLNPSFDIVRGVNGEDVIDLHRQEKADIILMDSNLYGLSGFEACRQIREFDTQTKILFLSADNCKTSENKALAVGGNEYLVKPITRKKLVQIIGKHLQEQSN